MLTFQELLTFHNYADVHIIGGWSAKTSTLMRIVELDQENSALADITEGDVLVVSSSCTGFLQQFLPTSAAGIIILGKAEEVLPFFATIKKFFMPVVSITNVDFAAINSSLPFLKELKRSGRIYSYLETCMPPAAFKPSESKISYWLGYLRKYVNNPVYLVDSAFQLYADEAQPGEQQELLQLIFHNQRTIRKDKSAGQTVFRGMVTLQEQQRIFYYTTALVADGYCYGHLVIQETVVCTPVDLCQYEAVSRFILEELIHRQHSVETERRYQSGFIYDLLYNNFDSNEVLIERGKLWGWDFTKIHHLLIVAIENKGDDYYFEASGILKAIQKAVRAYAPQALICEQQGQIVVIVRKGETEDERTNKKNSITLAKTLQQRMLTAFPDKKIAIGIGKSYPTAGDLCRSYQEAKTALELGPFLQQTNYIIHFEDLGLMRLLAVISYEQLEDYYKEYLACLEEYDTANATNLLETIECYFEQNGDLNATAEKLYLHPNSLRYRLKKIEDMINGDLQNLEYKLNLFAACKIRKILDNYFWQMSK